MGEQEKMCLNCKNFKRYYILNVSLRFAPVDKGFCVVRKCKGGGKRQVAQNENCDLWQSDERQRLRNRNLTQYVLQDISKKLEVVQVLLCEDKQQKIDVDEL